MSQADLPKEDMLSFSKQVQTKIQEDHQTNLHNTRVQQWQQRRSPFHLSTHTFSRAGLITRNLMFATLESSQQLTGWDTQELWRGFEGTLTPAFPSSHRKVISLRSQAHPSTETQLSSQMSFNNQHHVQKRGYGEKRGYGKTFLKAKTLKTAF